jgi:hypothetical protein|tara:strand:+ start:1176 stop:1352 length:177 start_codon:yes stop_codon:yes gene_type:complete
MSKDLDHKQSIIAICYQLALQESEIRGEFFRVDDQAMSYLNKIIQGAETWQEMEKEKK